MCQVRDGRSKLLGRFLFFLPCLRDNDSGNPYVATTQARPYFERRKTMNWRTIFSSLVIFGLVVFLLPHPAQAQGALERLGNLLDRLDPQPRREVPVEDPLRGERPFLGAVLDEPQDPNQQGLVVQEVNDNGPADQAGLEEGDLIVAVDGQAVSSLDRVSQVMQGKRPGNPLQLQVIRDGQSLTLTVALGAQASVDTLPPPQGIPADPRDPLGVEGDLPPADANPRRLGVRVIPLTDQIRNQAGISVRRGAFIESVSPRGVADRAGLTSGAVIVSYNGRRVDGPVDLIQLVQDSPLGQPIPVNYYLGNQVRTTEVVFGQMTPGEPQPPGPDLVAPETDRPALRILQQAIEAIEQGNPPPAGFVDPAEVEALRQRVGALEAEVSQLREELQSLKEGRDL